MHGQLDPDIWADRSKKRKRMEPLKHAQSRYGIETA